MTKTWKESNTLLKIREAGTDFEYRLTPEEKAAMSKPEPNAIEKHGERLWNTDRITITEKMSKIINDLMFDENYEGEWHDAAEADRFIARLIDGYQTMSYEDSKEFTPYEICSADGEFFDKGIQGWITIGDAESFHHTYFDTIKKIKTERKFSLNIAVNIEAPINGDVRNIRNNNTSVANLLIKSFKENFGVSKELSECRKTLMELLSLEKRSKEVDIFMSMEDLGKDTYMLMDFLVEFSLDTEPSAEVKKIVDLMGHFLNICDKIQK